MARRGSLHSLWFLDPWKKSSPSTWFCIVYWLNNVSVKQITASSSVGKPRVWVLRLFYTHRASTRWFDFWQCTLCYRSVRGHDSWWWHKQCREFCLFSTTHRLRHLCSKKLAFTILFFFSYYAKAKAKSFYSLEEMQKGDSDSSIIVVVVVVAT